MWIIDYCEKRLTECLRMSDSFANSDTERQRAWLELAKQWGTCRKKRFWRRPSVNR